MNKVMNKYYGTLKQRDWSGTLKRGDWFYAYGDESITLIALGDGTMAYIDTCILSSIHAAEDIEKIESESKIIDVQSVFEKYPRDYGQDMIGNLVESRKMFP